MTDENRPSPDALLAALRRDERQQRRGRLKVFLGMSPGVGKTYAMLEAAQRERRAGTDVVIGLVETHGRPETDALVAGLSALPRRRVEHRGVSLTELDLDALLARRPRLALVDELAHTNAPGSRHPKRYQDVAELLDAGIDVYTTLNVQHVGSRAEVVREITGTRVLETVPDSVLDEAELELVDIPPAELLRRLESGRVYVPERAAEAARSFFRKGNLTALRELALRLAAEHVGQDTRHFRNAHAIAQVWKTGQRLLVAISPSPLSEPMARWTRRLSDSLGAPWLAVYVDDGRPLGDEAHRRLQRNLTLARELGAEVVSTTDPDVVTGILRVARQHNVTQIVAGKPVGWRLRDLVHGGSLLGRLIRESGDIDVLCVRAAEAGARVAGTSQESREPAALGIPGTQTHPNQYLLAAGVVAGVTLLNLALRHWTGYSALSLVYLLSVVGLALFVGRGPILLAAAASALLWNFLFLPPVYTFFITSLQDGLMFAMFFVVAIAMGQLTARLRTQQRLERQREQHATALYLLTRELAEGRNLPELLGVVVRHVGDVFGAEVAVLLPDPPDRAEAPLVAYVSGTLPISDKEASVAEWAYRHARPAGWTTDTLPAATALHQPLATPGGCLGVLAVRPRSRREFTSSQSALLESFTRQIAIVMDRQRLRDREQEALLLAESERLGRSLLNSVSHELRTPLAAISSAASSLQTLDGLSPTATGLTVEIQEAAARLNRLVRNLLDVARLDAGQLRPKPDWCDVADLCQVAAKSAGPLLRAHPFQLQVQPGLPLVQGDFVLLEQAVVNLLANAAVHTPAGTPVELSARAASDAVVIEVADRGPGLVETDIPRLFDRFFRATHAPTGGTGLGLSIVKGFTEACGGRVEALNRPGGGAAFRLLLPAGKQPEPPEDAA